MRYLSVAVLLALSSTATAGSESHATACGGEACDAVIRGFFAFFDRQLSGLEANGRACADCHMVADHFQLSPASAEARFQLLQKRRQWNRKADDPLFRPSTPTTSARRARARTTSATCARTASFASNSRCRRTLS